MALSRAIVTKDKRTVSAVVIDRFAEVRLVELDSTSVKNNWTLGNAHGLSADKQGGSIIY